MTLVLPRLASFTIERRQISAWLARHEHRSLRCILGPAGSGKTTALVNYVRNRKNPVRYIHLKQRKDERSLETCLAEEFGLAMFHYSDLMAQLNACERMELVIDGIDRLHAHDSALLEQFVYEIPSHIGLIYSGITTGIAVHSLEAAGLASVLPREELFFSPIEAAELSTGLGLPKQNDRLVAILERSDGWSIVLADILRFALEQETSLVDAYERWLVQRGRSFSVYLQEEVSRMAPAARALFESVLSGERLDPAALTVLEDAGAFIVGTESGVRPYRVAADLLVQSKHVPVVTSDRLSIRMFGRFSIRNGDREVAWIRRRDQQIFRYIAVRPNGSVKKSEVIEVFWPDADPHLAAQSLRTACSNIRKAIASIVDTQMVEHLFASEGQELRVYLDRAVVDVQRFKAHINEGNEADNDGRTADAIAHYRAAEVLYRADLFGGEPDEAWFMPQREVYRGMASLARERIASLRIEFEELTNAI